MKFMNKINFKKQSGFSILAVILVIVAVVVAIGVWSLSGQSNISNNSSKSNDIIIEGLINDAAAIKSNIETYRITTNNNKRLDRSTFVFDRPTVNPKLIRQGATIYEGKWMINPSNFFASYVGNPSDEDVTILVGGVIDSVCKKINEKLQGVNTIPAITSYNSSSELVSDEDLGYSYNYVYLGSFSSLYGWSKGCFSVKNIPDNNVFFFVATPG